MAFIDLIDQLADVVEMQHDAAGRKMTETQTKSLCYLPAR